MTTAKRPLAVTLLAVLHILLGALLFLGGIGLRVIRFAFPEVLPHVRLFAPRSVVIGLSLLVLVVIDVLLAYGLWNGKGWAWIVALVFALLGIVFSVFSLFFTPGVGEAISLIIDLLIVYYLMQPRVQTYFGRGTTTPL